MEIIESITKTLNTAAEKANKGAEKLAITAKLKYRLSVYENQLDENMKTLGEMKYAELSGEEITDEEYAIIADEITMINKKLSVIEKRLYDLDNYTVCPECGARVRKTAEVCPLCEYVIKAETETDAAESLPEITEAEEADN